MDIMFLKAKKPVRGGWTINKVICCCLKQSVRVSKKPINVQVNVTI